MRPTLPAVFAALAVALVAGCGGGGVPPELPSSSPATSVPTQSGASGVQGRTMVDGGCPVIQENSPCPDRPLSARITVTRPGADAIVATTTSDATGRFRIALPPGTYVLHPAALNGGPFPAGRPSQIRVQPGRYTTVVVSFDSGIQ